MHSVGLGKTCAVKRDVCHDIEMHPGFGWWHEERCPHARAERSHRGQQRGLERRHLMCVPCRTDRLEHHRDPFGHFRLRTLELDLERQRSSELLHDLSEHRDRVLARHTSAPVHDPYRSKLLRAQFPYRQRSRERFVDIAVVMDDGHAISRETHIELDRIGADVTRGTKCGDGVAGRASGISAMRDDLEQLVHPGRLTPPAPAAAALSRGSRRARRTPRPPRRPRRAARRRRWPARRGSAHSVRACPAC